MQEPSGDEMPRQPTSSSHVGADETRGYTVVDHGIFSLFVEASSPVQSPRLRVDSAPALTNDDGVAVAGRPTQSEERAADGVIDESAFSTQQHDSFVAPSQLSHLQLLPQKQQGVASMKHRHQLPQEALDRGREMALVNAAFHEHRSPQQPPVDSQYTPSAAPPPNSGALSAEVHELHLAVPDPDLMSRSLSAQASVRPTSSGRGDEMPANASAAAAAAVALTAPLPLSNPGAIHRSDIDDAIIMQKLMDRQKHLQALAHADRRKEREEAHGRSEELDDDDDDGDDDDAQRPLASPVKSAHRNLQDDVFLESLSLVTLDPTVNWDAASTFRMRWFAHTYRRGKVERDFLRYEMHHNTFSPLLVFSMVLLLAALAVCVAVWSSGTGGVLLIVWSTFLGSVCGVTVLVAGAAYCARSSALLARDAESSCSQESDSRASSRKTRSLELWSARLAEIAAFALVLICVWGSLSAYGMITSLCFHSSVFYVPWVRDCDISAPGSNGAVLFGNQSCAAEIHSYCEHALYPFLVPAVVAPVILFRPRVLLSVPLILTAPFAFASSRYLTVETEHFVDTPSVFASKLALVVVIALFGVAVKIALEREQRRRFKAYATLYSRLSTYVRGREALAEFLDSKIAPLLRTRLLSGNLSIDFSVSATCAVFDICEFPVWCTRMLPLAAATSVMQLHDVLSARCASMGVEKIRSLGDVFVATSNLCVASPNHAALCCQLALQIFSDAYEFRHAFSAPLALRCGMHSGQLLGVVLGTTYRRYEVMGDALATALRVLDVTSGNQVVLTLSTADLAQHYVSVTERSTAFGSSMSVSSKTDSSGSMGKASSAGSLHNATAGGRSQDCAVCCLLVFFYSVQIKLYVLFFTRKITRKITKATRLSKHI